MTTLKTGTEGMQPSAPLTIKAAQDGCLVLLERSLMETRDSTQWEHSKCACSNTPWNGLWYLFYTHLDQEIWMSIYVSIYISPYISLWTQP